jgi:hypothetical protein
VTTTFEGADSGAAEDLRLQPIANHCTAGSCPTIYTTNSGPGTLVIQGFTVPAERAGIDVPAGEALVEIPLELLTEALRNLS